MTDAKEEPNSAAALRVLTLDGGGAKGFYTLGVLKEIEAMVGAPCTRSSTWSSAPVPERSSRR